MYCGGEPAILIDPPIAGHLEVLRRTARWRLGIIKGVEHADALDGLLRDAVDDLRLGQPDCLQDGRGYVDDVVPLADGDWLCPRSLGASR
jgi:hypothetical protein